MPQAAAALVASDQELAQLEAWLHSSSLPAGPAQRSRPFTWTKSEVSCICAGLDAEAAAVPSRPLSHRLAARSRR
jgi:hypothetical protein